VGCERDETEVREMYNFLIGVVVGGAVGVLGFYLGHAHAAKLWNAFVDVLVRDKAKLAADLSIAHSRIQDLIHKV
jgi:hypothetical protein